MPDQRTTEYKRKIDAMAQAQWSGTPSGMPGGNIDFQSAGTTASSGASALAGINIVWADQTESFIATASILENYNGENYWSVVFGVSAGAFTKAVTFDATQALWDDVGVAQTVYRLRVKTFNNQISPNAPTQISTYGQYREDILCVDGDPVVTLLNIS
jgi:hypothetical protein